MITRKLPLPPPGRESFFLWGPRQTGKSTLLKRRYPGAHFVDLLKAGEFQRYMARPELLREELRAQGAGRRRQVVIDEIQKVPALLDEVHWMMENMGLHFALCGSSARKVRRGGANLLGGRAFRYHLHGLTAGELGREFNLDRMLNHGALPRMYEAKNPARLLNAYVADYLKEEIAAEGLVRRLPVFSNFLHAAALSDGGVVNFANIARECGVSKPTAYGYFEILEDTLIGRWLPAYRRQAKRRVVRAPKFYFADVGVANRLARRGALLPGSEMYGKAFESWVLHELSAFESYCGDGDENGLSYWRLSSGAEVDFVVGDMKAAIEAKSGENITNNHLKGLRALKQDYPQVGRRIIVCREPRARKTSDGIEILPAADFAKKLWKGGI